VVVETEAFVVGVAYKIVAVAAAVVVVVAVELASWPTSRQQFYPQEPAEAGGNLLGWIVAEVVVAVVVVVVGVEAAKVLGHRMD
jgi:uncharacterized membrane protein